MEEWKVSQRIRLTAAKRMLPFSAGKTDMKDVGCTEKCSAALSTEIASIGLYQP